VTELSQQRVGRGRIKQEVEEKESSKVPVEIKLAIFYLTWGWSTLGILSLRVWFVTFVALFMALTKLLGLGFSVLPLWSQLLVFLSVFMIWLSSSTCHLAVGLFFFTWMI
jgi:hypothetical protein